MKIKDFLLTGLIMNQNLPDILAIILIILEIY